jgi:hypothetical protein
MEWTQKPRRIAWIVNHRTLMPAEVPILRDLGWEVYVPKILPANDPAYRSGTITYEYDSSLTISSASLGALNNHDFYRREWSPTMTRIMNASFQIIVASFSAYAMPLSEAAKKFSGLVVARVFGREHPARYCDIPPVSNAPELLRDLGLLGDRFVFGQGYHNLAEIEDEPLRSRGHTLALPLPSYVFTRRGSWRGNGSHALFLCPDVADRGYYQAIYERDNRDFGDLPHMFFGRQRAPVADPTVLPYLTDDELLERYASAPVFVYPSNEPRHVHYSPLEAMVVGAPVLYRAGALIDMLAGRADLPGRCRDTGEMREKAQRLLGGDRELADAIRSTQNGVLDGFSGELAGRQWQQLFNRHFNIQTAAA